MVPMLVRDREHVDLLLCVDDQVVHHAGHDFSGVRRAEHDMSFDIGRGQLRQQFVVQPENRLGVVQDRLPLGGEIKPAALMTGTSRL